MAKVNPWGGAIAHGHPLGATGAGLMAKMLAGLEATGGQFGLQVMCIGHGQATATIVDDVGSVELRETSQPVYDAPVALQLLREDPDTGAEHYVVRYPPGLRARWHRHTAAHTIVVLEGHLDANGRTVGPGAYCHFPGGVPMHHAPAGDDGCLFLILFEGPFDVELVDRPDV